MSDNSSPGPRGGRRRGNNNINHQQAHYASDSGRQYDVSDSGQGRQGGPITPAKPRNAKQPGSQQRKQASNPRGTPDGKRVGGGHGSKTAGYDGASDSQTNHQAPVNMTPARAAYAGPTFHASPAASSLPMPTRFFSKSMPADQPVSSLQQRLDGEAESHSPVPPHPQLQHESESEPLKPPPREESPLDIFFNAQKAERSGNRNSSPLSGGMRPGRTPTQAHPAQSPQATISRATPNPSKNMFMMELDGAGEANEESANISSPVPFRQRMQAVRTSSSPGQIPTQQTAGEADRQAKTLELKKLLSMQSGGTVNDSSSSGHSPFNFASPPPHSMPSSTHGYNAGSPHGIHYHNQHLHPNGTFFQGQNQSHGSGAWQNVPSDGSPARRPRQDGSEGSPAELPGSNIPAAGGGGGKFHNQISSMRQMEDNLKKLLKLDDMAGK